MGSTGHSIPIVVLPGATPAKLARVRKLVLEAITEVWGRMLPHQWRKHADTWINWGEDSLLTIGRKEEDAEVPTELTFWFYLTVPWASGLARHWLFLALVEGRLEIEQALAKCGFALDLARYPTGEDVREKTQRFFTLREGDREARIGSVAGAEIHWEMDAQGAYDFPATPVDTLDEANRAAVAAWHATRQCACPVCAGHVYLKPRLLPRVGTLTPLLTCTGYDYVRAFEGGALFVAARSATGSRWALHRASVDEPFRTVPALTHARRGIRFLGREGGRMIALVGLDSEPLTRTESLDRGATWSTPEPCGLPKLATPRFFSHAHAPHLVHACVPSMKMLFRSTDGGRTFAPLASGSKLLVTQKGKTTPKAIAAVFSLSVALADPARLLALLRTGGAKAQATLAFSTDSGLTFTPITVAGFTPQVVQRTRAGDVFVFGATSTGSALARSSDEGQTFEVMPVDAAPIALGSITSDVCYWSTYAEDYSLHVSHDLGRSFTRALDGYVATFTCDEVGTLFVVGGRTLYVHRA